VEQEQRRNQFHAQYGVDLTKAQAEKAEKERLKKFANVD